MEPTSVFVALKIDCYPAGVCTDAIRLLFETLATTVNNKQKRHV